MFHNRRARGDLQHPQPSRERRMPQRQDRGPSAQIQDILLLRSDIRTVFDEDFDYIVTPVAYDLDVEIRPAASLHVETGLGAPVDETAGTVRLGASTLFFSRSNGGFDGGDSVDDGGGCSNDGVLGHGRRPLRWRDPRRPAPARSRAECWRVHLQPRPPACTCAHTPSHGLTRLRARDHFNNPVCG